MTHFFQMKVLNITHLKQQKGNNYHSTFFYLLSLFDCDTSLHVRLQGINFLLWIFSSFLFMQSRIKVNFLFDWLVHHFFIPFLTNYHIYFQMSFLPFWIFLFYFGFFFSIGPSGLSYWWVYDGYLSSDLIFLLVHCVVLVSVFFFTFFVRSIFYWFFSILRAFISEFIFPPHTVFTYLFLFFSKLVISQGWIILFLLLRFMSGFFSSRFGFCWIGLCSCIVRFYSPGKLVFHRIFRFVFLFLNFIYFNKNFMCKFILIKFFFHFHKIFLLIFFDPINNFAEGFPCRFFYFFGCNPFLYILHGFFVFLCLLLLVWLAFCDD